MRLTALALCLAACSPSPMPSAPVDATTTEVGSDAAVDAGSELDQRYAAAARLRNDMGQVVSEAEAFVAARPEPAGWTEALRRWNQARDWSVTLADSGAPGSVEMRQRTIEVTDSQWFPAYCAIRALLRPSFTPSVEPRRSCADTDPEWWRAYL